MHFKIKIATLWCDDRSIRTQISVLLFPFPAARRYHQGCKDARLHIAYNVSAMRLVKKSNHVGLTLNGGITKTARTARSHIACKLPTCIYNVIGQEVKSRDAIQHELSVQNPISDRKLINRSLDVVLFVRLASNCVHYLSSCLTRPTFTLPSPTDSFSRSMNSFHLDIRKGKYLPSNNADTCTLHYTMSFASSA